MALIDKLINIADAIRSKTGKVESLTLDDMATEIAEISTGVELNFEVVGGTVEPENPTENMIWVNTDVEISNWTFSAKYSLLKGVDIYTSEGSKAGYYINSSGTETASTSLKLVTKKIPLPEGTQSVTIYAYSENSTAVCHGFYDENGNLISTVFRRPGTTTYNVPANAKSIRASYMINDTESLIANRYDGIEDGTVWFSTGTFSTVEFNTLKENSVMTYPLSAKQWVDGSWANREVEVYKNGAWISLTTFFYNRGDECADITGGWNGVFDNPSASYWSKGTFIKNGDSVSMSGGNRQAIRFITARTVDVTNIDTLLVNVERCYITGSTAYVKLGVGTTANGENQTAYTLIKETGMHSLDVSHLNGSYYIYVRCDGDANSTFDIRVSEVRAQ